ncbi:hypothetical protein HN51_041337 [Arachis hypogaea]
MRYVDVGIPANNKGKHNIGCLVDLFFYRDPEEAKQQEEEELPAAPEYAFKILVLLALPASLQLMGHGGLLQLNNPGLNQFLNNPL